ncbi:uncharacterized protein EV420DRAFT_1650813 [Desarmillaria tabescens]|uniref:Uncharacterized protein n=1 Tax=Armillaria tabescens TaxID=1929756 RepID=A0AA39MLY3_ARMTA|nr:uncharacterized protein EV420DRAFT_1650813 [Desarmillaria tabescens]KAK0439696.1 hypothetical protein EV420DRAFT_1650813 [Desarmillaria tabescens]
MPQNDPDFSSIKIIATQYSDSFFNEVIIESLTHGMYAALLSIVLWQILSSATIYRRQVKILAGVSVFMYILAIMHLAMFWFYARWTFITKGETEEKRYFTFMNYIASGHLIWAVMICNIVESTNILVADCVIIWRCWIIWEKNWRIIVLPCICTLCGLIFGILVILQQLVSSNNLQKNLSKGNWAMAYYVMALPTTAMCTALIVYRLTKVSKTRNSPHFTPNPYHHVIEMLVESSGLYVVVLAVFIVFEAMNSPYSNYPAAVLQSAIGIAPALILLRVVSRNTTSTGPPSDNMHSRPFKRLVRLQTGGSERGTGYNDVMIIGPEKTVQVI